jgi:hypothetical protein
VKSFALISLLLLAFQKGTPPLDNQPAGTLLAGTVVDALTMLEMYAASWKQSIQAAGVRADIREGTFEMIPPPFGSYRFYVSNLPGNFYVAGVFSRSRKSLRNAG